ncbi:HAD-IA family hydrolase [Haliovirga abyssi]|uniref:Noncanonical pyrimidine nucleotidase, YjjG family protein n=1 Tax=Haliovirga abyssi TaxID=2996794 RepID=A0AAU9DWB0_9FUSO|nr:HAD-IA family hydrolase [Haliovirga abyssi]BDU49490.1 noncanonical pyrimidine nucleotidase, YjjG family protein [Haliovirga abyssi]
MKAVILDMYGVILKEPGEGFISHVHKTFSELDESVIFKYIDMADVGTITSLEMFEALGYKGDLEAIEKEYLDTIKIDESFYDFAKNIKKKYKLGLISNDSSRWSEYLRSKYKVNELFDSISISGDLKYKKPDPRIFNHSLSNLSCLASDCIYADDRRYNMEAANAVGIESILFNSRKVEYTGKQVSSFQELTKHIMYVLKIL